MAKTPQGFTAGDRVLSPQFGTGTIREVNDVHTTIDFDEHGAKKFITRMVQLSSTDTTAPTRRRAASKTKKSR